MAMPVDDRREKREGFGVPTPQKEGPPILFQTPDYRVVPGTLSAGPEGTAPELLFRYIIQHKKHGIVYATVSGFGQAIAQAVTAQIELQNATEAAGEYAARNYNPKQQQNEGTGIPDFSGLKN